MAGDKLLNQIERLKSVMINVATGGDRIDDVNTEFQELFTEVTSELARRGIDERPPYRDLWDWYGRWSSGDLPSYQSRRIFVSEALAPLVDIVSTGHDTTFEPTGWMRVDRNVGELRERFARAKTEEQFQVVGLLCREALISLSQAVYDSDSHPTVDGVRPSETDAKRRLEAFIKAEMGGGSNKEARQHARSTLGLALKLQHDRAAGFRAAAMCVEATTTVINIVAIVSGRRDPEA